MLDPFRMVLTDESVLLFEQTSTVRAFSPKTDQYQLSPNKIKRKRYKNIYYIDTSVLLGNIPLVKFMNATSGTRVVYFP